MKVQRINGDGLSPKVVREIEATSARQANAARQELRNEIRNDPKHGSDWVRVN